MARFQNDDRSRTTWWVHVNLTTVIGIVALLAVGFIVKYEYDKGREQEVQDAERSRREREARDRETAILLAEREKDQREVADARRKDDKELATERMILEEQRRLAKQKAEEERLAEAQALKLQAAKVRDALLDEQRKQLQAEREAAAKKAADLAAQQAAQQEALKKMSAAQLREQYDKAVKDLDGLPERLKAIEARLTAFKNRMDGAARQGEAFQKQATELGMGHNTTIGAAGGVRLATDNSDEIAKARARADAAAKESSDSASGYARAQAEREAALKAIEDTRSIRDEAASRLKAMGVEVAEKAEPKAQPRAAGIPLAGPPKKTFVLKDGQKIVALTVVEAPEAYSVKKEDGKFATIPKEAVDKIIEE